MRHLNQTSSRLHQTIIDYDYFQFLKKKNRTFIFASKIMSINILFKYDYEIT